MHDHGVAVVCDPSTKAPVLEEVLEVHSRAKNASLHNLEVFGVSLKREIGMRKVR